MSKDLHDKDRKILDILKKNSKTPLVEIGRTIGLSESAVRRRISNLENSKIIKRFTVEIDSGPVAKALSLISINPSSLTPQVANNLKAIEGVEVIYEITGQYDIAAILSATNISNINSCIDEIRRIDGVSDSNTIIILRELR